MSIAYRLQEPNTTDITNEQYLQLAARLVITYLPAGTSYQLAGELILLASSVPLASWQCNFQCRLDQMNKQ